MSITSIITSAEADVFLALSPDWMALPSGDKDLKILNASLYIHSKWSCTGIDWSDLTTIDEDIKRACAYYAEADRVGVLFDAIVKEDKHGKKTMYKQKLEGMEEVTQWSMFGQIVNGYPLQMMDSLMTLHCKKRATERLIRV